MKQLTLNDLYEHFQTLKKNELILDVRSAEEFQEVHIPGAKNQDYREVEAIANDLKQYQSVYIHCRRGGRAQKAFETLQSLGLKNLHCIAEGGMDLWCDLNYPTVTNKT